MTTNQLDLFQSTNKQQSSLSFSSASEFLQSELPNCTRCPLFALRGQDNQPVGIKGKADNKVVLIGEAPGKDETKLGIPFVGKAGNLLDQLLRLNQIPTEKIYFTNIVKCRPPNNRTPHVKEIAACRNFIDKEIELINPNLIICVGTTAANTILNIKSSMTESAGKLFTATLGTKQYKTLVLYHPAALLYEEHSNNKTATEAMKRHLKEHKELIISCM